MHEIITFAQSASPLAVIALLAIIIFELTGGKGVINKIRGTQKEKYPSIEEYLKKMAELAKQNETLLENHFKHEIPDMVKSINRIETKVDDITKTQINQGLDIARLKALEEK